MNRVCILLIGLAPLAAAQSGSDLANILKRLDDLEQDNRALRLEVRGLREELDKARASQALAAAPGTGPTAQEQSEVQERRIEELAQSKVDASQKFPLAVTGMLLFNAFHNGTQSGTSQDPVTAALTHAASSSGASVRQTILGLTFNGPSLPGDGNVTGAVYMDFFAGSRDPDNHMLRIRTASLDLNWKNTTISFGQDKPIIAPREPDSLAMVGISPLTGAGDLWDWQPQARIEQRFHFGSDAGLTARVGVYETAETDANVPAAFANTLEYSRPGYEGRFNLWMAGHGRRIEIAPGFHLSTTHVAGTSVDSRIASLDWLVRPAAFFEFTGAWFQGQDVAPLGALRQGFTVLGPGNVRPVHSVGGWSQAAFFLNPRLTLHLFGGEQQDRASDLNGAGIHQNIIYAGNLMYRLAPNVLASFEASQTRTNYVTAGLRLNNHYDLALAYLF